MRLDEVVQEPEERLRSADREGRDEHLRPARYGVLQDDLEVALDVLVRMRVFARAVRALHHHDVDGLAARPGRVGVAEDRAVRSAQVAGEDDAALVALDLHARGAEDVARFVERERNAEDVGTPLVGERPRERVEAGEEARDLTVRDALHAEAVLERDLRDRERGRCRVEGLVEACSSSTGMLPM